MLKLVWESVENDQYAYDYYSNYCNIWEFDGNICISPYAIGLEKPLYNNYGIRDTYLIIVLKKIRDNLW